MLLYFRDAFLNGLGCFLGLLLNSLGVFGTSLGSLLGLSRGSWGLSWAFLALLGLSWVALLVYLGAPFGLSWAAPPRAKKDRKSNEKGFHNLSKNSNKWGPKMGPVLEAPWGALLGPLGIITPGKISTTDRAGGLGRGRGGTKDPPKRLGKRSLEGTVCSVAKRAEDLHALRHKASAD